MDVQSASAESATLSGSGLATSRGRGGMGPMRGSFERGRGRGLSRGHYSGAGSGYSGSYSSRGSFSNRGGGMGSSSGHQGRGGGYIPRGGVLMRGGSLLPSSGLPGRGSFSPRGSGLLRGSGRAPLYTQSGKHSGVDNNKTVTPINNNSNSNVASVDDSIGETGGGSSVNSNANPSLLGGPSISAESNSASNTSHCSYRGGSSRGRGMPLLRGGVRSNQYAGYNNNVHSMHVSNSMTEHTQIRRTASSRGRGGYSGFSSAPRTSLHQSHISNSPMQQNCGMKRCAPGMMAGSKRGRYDGTVYNTQRPTAPKYQVPHHIPTVQQQETYGTVHPQAQQIQNHHGYVAHDSSQGIEQYASTYTVPNNQSVYNGYGQGMGYASQSMSNAVTHTTNEYMSHIPGATEYDQSQYHNYSTSYNNQQPVDTRYATYGHDYTQQYGAPAIDYNTTSDYSQHSQQTYDDRMYGGYDTQSYHQIYSSSAGYY